MLAFAFELGGAVGVDPRPFSLRQLLWMAEGRGRAEWSRVVSAVWWTVKAASGAALAVGDIAPGVFDDEVDDEPRELTEAEVEAQSAAAWAVMHDYFRHGGR